MRRGSGQKTFTDATPEARFGGEIAERDRRLGATWAGRTCESPRATADLEALLAFPLLRGIHRTLHFETDGT